MPRLSRLNRLSRRSALGLAASWALATPARAQLAAPPPTDTLTDAPFIDSFGPVGGADDTPTFAAALRSGAPFRLRPRSYRIAGPLIAQNVPVIIHGTPGATRLVGTGLATGIWFAINTNAVIDIDGITFDGNGAKTGSGVGMLVITGSPTSCSLRRCAVMRASNAAGLLISVATDGPDDPLLVLDQVEAGGNAGEGIWLEHGVNAQMTALRLHTNKASGLRCHRFANRVGSPIRRIVVRDSFAWRNGLAGFAIGTYNEAPGGQPVVLGPSLPDVVDVTLASLFAWNNTGYGIFADADDVRVSGCRTRSNGENGGICANARRCTIDDCQVSDERGFGIDTGGSYEVAITRCRVATIAGTGLNPGGSYMTTGSDNHITGCTGAAIAIWNTEYGGGAWLQFQANHVRFSNTTIDISRLAGGHAIVVRDGARNVVLDGLDIVSNAADGKPAPGPERVLYAATAAIRVTNARFNGASRFLVTPTAGVLDIPDIAETVFLPAGNQALTRIQTATAASVGTGIGWITVTTTGRGYDATTTATLEGDGDIAAVGKLVPNVWTGGGGRLIGFRLPRPGRGFTRASVRLAGPGTGAVVAVQIGIPIPAERRLLLVFPGGGKLSGSLPPITVPPGGTVALMEFNGAWIAAPR